MNSIETFKVVSVSKNTNAFGLYGVIIVNKRGIAYEIGVGSLFLPAQNKELTGYMQDDFLMDIDGIAYEIPNKLPNAPTEVVNEIFKSNS